MAQRTPNSCGPGPVNLGVQHVQHQQTVMNLASQPSSSAFAQHVCAFMNNKNKLFKLSALMNIIWYFVTHQVLTCKKSKKMQGHAEC